MLVIMYINLIETLNTRLVSQPLLTLGFLFLLKSKKIIRVAVVLVV